MSEVNSLRSNNISIGFWNIDGLYETTSNLRSCKLGYSHIEKLLRKFDIIGLVETHCGHDEKIAFDGYKIFSNCRKKNRVNNRFYGGISVLVRNNIHRGVKFIESSTSEIQWLKLSKSYFNLDEDIYLGIVYIAPKRSGFSVNSDEDIFGTLESNVAEYSKFGQCLILGDFNGRTAKEADFCEEDNLDQHLNLPTHIINGKYLPRNNLDTAKVDEHGSTLLSLCKSSDLRILNGRQLGDTFGNPTCYSHNGAPSVIDYGLSSENLLHIID